MLPTHVYLMGIVNVSPESFSGDGLSDPRVAVEYGLRLVNEGAHLLDVGGQSTRPGSEEIAADEEIRRAVPVVKRLAADAKVPVSIDTYKPQVAAAALDAGAALVNDISGLSWNPEMAALCAGRGVPLVMMHTSGRPAEMQHRTDYANLIEDICAYFEKHVTVAEEQGLSRSRVVLDPGIGFGKTPAQNLEILRRLGEFLRFDLPLLVGPSRKSFIGAVLNLGPQERVEGTAAAVALAVAGGASFLRVHDVAAMARVARLAAAVVYGMPDG